MNNVHMLCYSFPFSQNSGYLINSSRNEYPSFSSPENRLRPLFLTSKLFGLSTIWKFFRHETFQISIYELSRQWTKELPMSIHHDHPWWYGMICGVIMSIRMVLSAITEAILYRTNFGSTANDYCCRMTFFGTQF